MSYRQGPYQHFTTLPAPTNCKPTAARGFSYHHRRYLIDDEGDVIGMPPTRQRVMLTLAFDSGEPPLIQSDKDKAMRVEQILKALSPLVNEGAIKILTVEVDMGEGGRCKERVVYFDCSTAKPEQIDRWLV